MSFSPSFGRFMRARKKFWLLPDRYHDAALRRAGDPDQGLGRRAVHLHAVLSSGRDAHPRHFGLLPRQRGRAGRGRRDRRRGAGGALHAQEARCRVSRVTPSHYCLAEARHQRSSDVDHVVFYDKPFLKFERLLETYLAFAPRGFKSFRMAMPLWLREKLFQKDLLRKELRAIDAGIDWRTKLLFTEHHLSHAASRVLSLAVRGGRRPDHGRRRRMGDHVGRRRRAATSSRSARRSISRIRSACSIRRSPITPASRSIPASTR